MKHLNVQAVYIIRLKDSEKTQAHLLKEVAKIPFPENVHVEIFQAVNGKELDQKENHWKIDSKRFQPYSAWKIEGSENGWYKNDMTPGEIGCSISHFLVWEKAIEAGHRNVLILEEDFQVIAEKEKFDLSLPQENANLMYLGRSKIGKEKEKEIGNGIVRAVHSYCSHAYMANRLAMINLSSSFNQNLIPLDEYLIARTQKHGRKDIQGLYKKEINSFALLEDVIKQTSTALTSTVGHPDVNEDLRDFKLSKPLQNQEFEVCDIEEVVPNAYVFTVFPPDDAWRNNPTNGVFGKKIIEAAEASGWETDRHVSYPTQDMLLSKFGFELIYNEIVEKYYMPLAKHLYKLGGKSWDDLEIESFIVKYTPETQSYLSCHHDDSDLTFSLALNNNYAGGGLFFEKHKKAVKALSGQVTVHPGNITHRHGAREIYSGKRYVIVSFVKRN